MSSILCSSVIFALSSESAGQVIASLVLQVLVFFMALIPFAIAMVFGLAIGIGFAIFNGIPIYKMAKKAGVAHPWLAFIPYGNYWVEVMLAKKPFDMFGGKIVWEKRSKAAGMVLLAMTVPLAVTFVLSFLSIIPFVGFLIVLFMQLFVMAYTALILLLKYFINEDILDTYLPNDENKILWLVLSLVFPIAYTIVLYMHMNDEPNYEYEDYYKRVARRGQATQANQAAPVNATPSAEAPVKETPFEAAPVNKTTVDSTQNAVVSEQTETTTTGQPVNLEK